MRTLRRTCRRTRIDPLEVGVIFAGDDPADTAQTYGYANAALWTLMPKLEELFYIPKPSVYLGMDFTKDGDLGGGDGRRIAARVRPLCHSLYVGDAGGKMVPALAQGARGEAKAEPPAERAAAPETNEPEKRTA